MAPKRFIFEFSQIEKMNLNEQNDPDEFYEKILSRIYEETCILVSDTNNKEWDNNFKNKHSFVNENFYGQYKSEIVCLNCNHNSLTYSPFITLKLEIVNIFATGYMYLDSFQLPEQNLLVTSELYYQ